MRPIGHIGRNNRKARIFPHYFVLSAATAFLGRVNRLLTDMQHHFASMRLATVFEQVESLPGPQHHPTAGDRDRKGSLRQRRLNVSRHVVRTFNPMCQITHGRIVRRRH